MKNLTWKLNSSQYVFKDKWFIARADNCTMPNGKIVQPYYVLEFPNWCNVVVVTPDEKIVMVRQYRHAIQQTTIELPGGVIDNNEQPMQAAIREVQEETGYAINDIQLLYSTAPNPATNNNTAYFFIAKNAQPIKQQSFDEFEDLEVLLYTKQQVLQMLQNGSFMHGVQIGALYAALKHLNWL